MVDSTNLPEVDINQIATDLNGKMDRDGVNASCPVVISRTANNQGGVVEIWSDGYCVQTGVTTMNGRPVTQNLSQSYKDNTFLVYLTCGSNTAAWPIAWTDRSSNTTSSFWFDGTGNCTTVERSLIVYWRTEGYIR